jgi:hypothetical protein
MVLTNTKTCIYCGTAAGVTADHVPPKSFFPRPRPSNLTTVPSCLACNQVASRDEEYFLASLMFSDAGVTEPGRKLWAEKLHRMYVKNPGIRRQVAQSLQPVDLRTPAGIHLGRRMALRYNEKRLEAVVEKIVRGLFYLERGTSAPTNWDIMSLFVTTPANHQSVARFNHMLKPGAHEWPMVFQYRVGFVPDEPEKSMWLLWFWRTHIFWVTARPQPSGTENDG